MTHILQSHQLQDLPAHLLLHDIYNFDTYMLRTHLREYHITVTITVTIFTFLGHLAASLQVGQDFINLECVLH